MLLISNQFYTTGNFFIFLAAIQVSFGDIEEYSITSWCKAVAVLNDQMFLLCHPPEQHYLLNVCDRADPKRVFKTIQLPGVTVALDLIACNVSSCVYILHKMSTKTEVLKISNGENYQVSHWISCFNHPVSKLAVAADGCLTLFQGPNPSSVSCFNKDSSVKQEMKLAEEFPLVRNIFTKSNGNTVLLSNYFSQIERDGSITHSDLNLGPLERIYEDQRFYAADNQDRLLTIFNGRRARLHDSELMQTDVAIFPLRFLMYCSHEYHLSYNKQHNEYLLLDLGDISTTDEDMMHRYCQHLTVFSIIDRILQLSALQAAIPVITIMLNLQWFFRDRTSH